jgi:hypothetical protein
VVLAVVVAHLPLAVILATIHPVTVAAALQLLTVVLTLAAAAAAAILPTVVLVVLVVAALVETQLTVQVQQAQQILVVAEAEALVDQHRAVMVLAAVPVSLLFLYLRVVTREPKAALLCQPVVVTQS